MSADREAGARRGAGLCDSCRHQRVVRNTRGSVFSMCERSKADDRFPKYPRLPVLECLGFEPESPDDGSGERRKPAREPG